MQVTPQLAQACARWAEDRVLMDFIRAMAQESLEQTGQALDMNTVLREQGAYKKLINLVKFIEGGAIAHDLNKHHLQRRAV